VCFLVLVVLGRDKLDILTLVSRALVPALSMLRRTFSHKVKEEVYRYPYKAKVFTQG